MVERIEAEVPDDATLGTVVGEADMDYLLDGLTSGGASSFCRDEIHSRPRSGSGSGGCTWAGLFPSPQYAPAGRRRLSDSGTLLIRR